MTSPTGSLPPSAEQGPMSAVEDADFRRMIDAVTDYAVFLLDPDGIVRTWNAGARLLKGYEAQEVVGRHFSIFYPADQVERGWPAHELAAARELGRFEDEGWRLRKDGSRFWANVVITRLLDEHGRLRGFSKITRDLTARREHDELLRQSEERFRLVVDRVRDYAIFMLDPRGHIMSWNAGAQEIKGYTANEIVGKHFSVFYPPDVAASGWPARELELAVRDGRFEEEGWRVRKDGSRFWASVVITALFDDGGNHRGFAKVTRDLTDKRRIRMLEDEGRRLTTFLAMLGHELRNPLAPISNALAIMQMEEIESAHVRAAREVIGRQLSQMIRLIDDLLDLGRISSGKIRVAQEPVNLSEALMQAVEAVQPLVRQKGHVLESRFEAHDAWVCGDRARIVQVVGNLLTNAAKFTPSGGRIELRTESGPGHVLVRVKDNGPGIAPAMLEQVFEPFVQEEQDPSRAQGGLGLGLSVVQQMVARHGGEVSAFSSGKPGQGCEFIVKLPTIPAPPPREADGSTAAGAARGRILVVEDNIDSATTLVLLLQLMGYEATMVHDGVAALASIERERPDAVFLDIGLPGLSGLEVAREVTAKMPRPPRLIALTGYGQDSDRQASESAGFHAHVVKPLQQEDLARVLAELLPQGQPGRPSRRGEA
ncbi:MAG: PAS domain S-box protein [Pseudomonadota bacterium]|nr:PAS domain S-box protein [Pseudomonadota bacterium]